MSVPEEYRIALRQRLMGKGTSLVQESAPKAAPVIKEPHAYWKTGGVRTMSENKLASPFKWKWESKSTDGNVSFVEEKPMLSVKQKPLAEAAPKPVYSGEVKVVAGLHKVL